MEDNRIQCLVPAKQNACHRYDHHIESQYDIEGIHTLFVGQKNGNKIRSSACGSYLQAHTDRQSVYHSSENTDQKNIICDCIYGKNIRQDTGKYDHQTGISCKFFSNKPKSYIYRNRIQNQVNKRVRNRYMKKQFCHALDQNGKSCNSTGIKVPRPHKGFNVHCHDNRRNADNKDSLSFLF